jgi:hypothetical protein
MIVAGVSRKMSDLNVKQRWGARAGVSLMMGLVFLLCAKASTGDEEMRAFLLNCAIPPEGYNFADSMDFRRLQTIKINLPEASNMPVPKNWGNLRIEGLEIRGLMSGADKNMHVITEKEDYTLKTMLVLVAEITTLKWVHLKDMAFPEALWLPNQLLMAKQMSKILFSNVIYFNLSIPEGFQVEQANQLRFDKFTCAENNLPCWQALQWTVYRQKSDQCELTEKSDFCIHGSIPRDR